MCTEKIIFVAGNTHEYVAKKGNCDFFCSRAPHGARGLKPSCRTAGKLCQGVCPSRSAWLETR